MADNSLLNLVGDPNERGVRKTDPGTSKAAARKIDPSSKRAKILKLMSEHPLGMATFQVADLLRYPRDSVSSQMMPLQRGGWVTRNGKEVINPRTSCGSELWVVTEKYLRSNLCRMTTLPSVRDTARTLIQDASAKIADAYRSIHVVAKSTITDYDTKLHLVSQYKECDPSPVGMCVWLLDGRKATVCRYCGGRWKGVKPR